MLSHVQCLVSVEERLRCRCIVLIITHEAYSGSSNKGHCSFWYVAVRIGMPRTFPYRSRHDTRCWRTRTLRCSGFSLLSLTKGDILVGPGLPVIVHPSAASVMSAGDFDPMLQCAATTNPPSTHTSAKQSELEELLLFTRDTRGSLEPLVLLFLVLASSCWPRFTAFVLAKQRLPGLARIGLARAARDIRPCYAHPGSGVSHPARP